MHNKNKNKEKTQIISLDLDENSEDTNLSLDGLSLDLSEPEKTEKYGSLTLESSVEKKGEVVNKANQTVSKDSELTGSYTIDMPDIEPNGFLDKEHIIENPQENGDYVLQLSDVDDLADLSQTTEKKAEKDTNGGDYVLDLSGETENNHVDDTSFVDEKNHINDIGHINEKGFDIDDLMLSFSDTSNEDEVDTNIVEPADLGDTSVGGNFGGSYTLDIAGFSDEDYAGGLSADGLHISNDGLDVLSSLEKFSQESSIDLIKPEEDQLEGEKPVLTLKDLDSGEEPKIDSLNRSDINEKAPVIPPKTKAKASGTLEIKKRKKQKSSPVNKSKSAPAEPAPKQVDIITEISEQILRNVIIGNKTDETGVNSIFDLSEEEVLTLIKPALERLGLQLERTIGRFLSTQGGESKISNIYASGAVSCQKSIANNLVSQISNSEAEITHLPLNEENDSKRFKDINDLEKDAYIPAIGMALSDIKETPNFLFSYKERAFEKIVKWTFRGLFLILGLSFISAGIADYCNRLNLQENRIQILNLQKQVKNIPELLNRNSVLKLTGRKTNYEANISISAKKLIPLAVLNEITEMIPTSIKLIQVDIENSNGKRALIEGVVMGKESILESKLVEFLFTVGKNSFFQRPVIRYKKYEKYNGRRGLHFSIHMKIN